MRVLSALLLVLFLQVALGAHLGTISVSFEREDPADGTQVDAIIALGDSLEATITLSEAPTIPIRFDVVSSLPEVIQVSHPRITFNRGQTTGVVTLESLPDGQIGRVTVIVTPERVGEYQPTSFEVLVQGRLSVTLATTQCVGVGVPANILVTANPIAPEDITFTLSATSGAFLQEEVVIPLGKNEVLVQFNANQTGDVILSASADLYAVASRNLTVLGSIFTSGPATLIQDAPSTVSVSVLPAGRPVIFVSSDNAIVTPSSFVLESDGSSDVEIIPEEFGVSTVIYRAQDYCAHTDVYDVSANALCAQGYIATINGTTCVNCPGNTDAVRQASDCSGRGTCAYSKCNYDSSVCFCTYPYVGSVCQFSQFDFGVRVEELTDEVLTTSLTLGDYYDYSALFTAPGDLVSAQYQPGRAVIANYARFPLQVDPAMNIPVTNGVYTGISFTWENLCYENTLIPNFSAPVELVILPGEDTPAAQFYQIELFVWNPQTRVWEDSVEVCSGLGFETDIVLNFVDRTLTTSFCRSGQYAFYIVPNSRPAANTGYNTQPNAPVFLQNGASPGTGRTGWQPAPPLPNPAGGNDGAYDPSPRRPWHFDSESSASTITASLVAIALMLVAF